MRLSLERLDNKMDRYSSNIPSSAFVYIPQLPALTQIIYLTYLIAAVPCECVFVTT